MLFLKVVKVKSRGEVEEELRCILIKPKWRISFSQIVCVILCLLVLLYPIYLDFKQQHKSDEVITTYSQQYSQPSPETIHMLEEAKAYNARLANEPYEYDGEISPAEEILSKNNTAIGWIEFPEFDERVPIYYGTTEEVLQQGVGNLEGTSLPIGGVSTHSVLSGHTGMPNTRMFDDIDQIEIGQVFLVHVNHETLAYKVYNTEIVLPTDSSSLAIQKGRDLCSLVTCYPYGVNSHRYIVHAERTDYVDIQPDLVPGSLLNQRTYPFIIAFCVFLFLFFIWWTLHPKEIGHNAQGIKRFYRHDFMPDLPVLPKAIYESVYYDPAFIDIEKNVKNGCVRDV